MNLKPLLLLLFAVLLTGMVNNVNGQSKFGVRDRVAGAFKGQKVPLVSPVILDNIIKPDESSGYHRYMSLKFSESQYADILHNQPSLLYMTFPVNATETVNIRLYRARLFSDNFTMGVSDKVYDHSNLDMGVHYQGVIESHESTSIVSLSFYDGKLEGLINCKDLNNFNISSLRPPAGEQIIAYTPEDMVKKPEMLGCANISGINYSDHQLEEPLQTRENLAHCVDLWLEANYNIYVANGNNLTNTTAFCNALFNASATIYNNEQITLNLGHLEIWTNQSPYPDPNNPNIDDRTEMLTAFQNYRASGFTGHLAELITQNNIGGVAAGFSGLCNPTRSQSMCISGMYGTSIGTYPNYTFNAYIATHEKGHLFGSYHTHACAWNGNNTAIDGCPGSVEGSCSVPPLPAGGGTIMSYCWNSHWIDFTLGFGPQPGAVIRNSVNNASCLPNCGQCIPPVITIAANPNPVCERGTLNLSSSGGASYAWSGPNNWSSTLQNPVINNIQLSAAGVYAVTVTATDGCTAAASVNVTVSPRPVATAGANPNPVCVGGILNLTSSGGASYSWSGPGGFTSSLQNPIRNNIQASHAGVYAVTVTAINGCTSAASVNVTVSPLPVATAGATPNPVCVGMALNLTSSGGATYSWSGPGGFTSSLQNPVRGNIQQSHAGIYTVTVTSAAGCTATATVNVTVGISSQVSASVSPNPVCEGELTRFNAEGGISFKWSGPNNFTAEGKTFGLRMKPSMAGVYTVTVTNSAGCTGTATVNVTVNPAPAATVSVTPQPACSGQTVEFSATGGTSYSWKGPHNFNSNLPNPVIKNVQQYHSGTYIVEIKNSFGCTRVLRLDLKVNQSPAGKIAYDTTSICAGGTLKLFASGGTYYSWSGPGGWTSNLQNPVRTNNSFSYSGLYTVSISNPSGCATVRSVYVTIRPGPNAIAWTTTPEVCEGSTVYLFSQGGVSYHWEGPYGYRSDFQNPIITGIPVYMSGGYIVNVANEFGCSTRAWVNITVTSINAQVNATPNPVPVGGTLYLTASGGDFYQWTGPNGFHTTQQNPIIHNFRSANEGIYTCIVSTNSGCNDTRMVVVKVTSNFGTTDGEVIYLAAGTFKQVYPNPASESIFVESDYQGEIAYNIVDLSGKVVAQGKTFAAQPIQINDLVSGSYLIQWNYQEKDKSHSYISRFIKTK